MVKIDRGLIGLVNDLYIANVYVVPETSVYSCHDGFDILRGDLGGFPTHSDFLICGDYNAHTNILPDFICEFSNGNDGDLPAINSANDLTSALIKEMSDNGKLKRFSKDAARASRHGIH